MTMPRCRAWHQSPPTVGWMHSRQLQPGSCMKCPTVMSPSSTTRTLTLGNSSTSSGVAKLFTWCSAISSARGHRIADVRDRPHRLRERDRDRRDEDGNREPDEENADRLPKTLDLECPHDRADRRRDHPEDADQSRDECPCAQRSV